MKSSEQIRQEFLDFFKSKNHKIVPSASLVPADDPTLMFINSGMAPFRNCFLGIEKPPAPRVADTQKCLRVSGKHNDLEEVGYDHYHHTLFEMLGNWSFGDYFKEDAIAWSWELLTEVWNLDPHRLYVTVHEGEERWQIDADEEAIQIWLKQPNMHRNRILFGSTKDNFWMMGETGPCGPCSEIHYDGRSDEERAKVDGASLVNQDHPDVVEIWNNVFIQFNALPDGKLETLKSKFIDTGMGFERIVRTIQGKTSNYDTDIFQTIFAKLGDLCPLTGVSGYDQISNDDEAEIEKIRIAFRVIADHIRTVAFAIADGVNPSNEGRGYVIRRILRRAVRYGYQSLGFQTPFFHLLVGPLKQKMGEFFPELEKQQNFVEKIIHAEEESFLKTLKNGIDLFQKAAEKDGKITGKAAFKLHDTYGFPFDLTALMAREQNLSVDEAGFEVEMQKQKDRARAASGFKVDQSRIDEWHELSESMTKGSVFLGYETLKVSDAQVKAIRTISGEENPIYQIELDKTPFYAESGGQVGDIGTLKFGNKMVQVLNTQKMDGRIVHFVDALPAEIDGAVVAEVDKKRRAEICKHHTATHLLHAALRKVLGTHVQQKGSLVAPDRLRFDFSHFEKVSEAQLKAVEARVNRKIQKNICGNIMTDVPIDDAMNLGAMALFGEKYGDKVRMVQFGKSIELCGGTHVASTAEIGQFRLVSEGSVAGGIRRVEALCGTAAEAFVMEAISNLNETKSYFKASKNPLATDVANSLEALKNAEKTVAQLKQQLAAQQLSTLIQNANAVGEIRVVKGKVEGVDGKLLGDLAQQLRDQLGANAIAVLAATDGEKVFLSCSVSDDLLKQFQAGKLVGELAKMVDGGGGGRPQLAIAGGKNPTKITEMLASVEKLIEA